MSSPRKIGALEPIAALNRVRIVENGEPLVDIRSHCPDVETPHGVCPYLRRTVAEMLNRAAAALPAGHRFRVGTALRTLGMQRRGWDGYFQRMREQHPAWPLSALRRATNRYFAPYDQPAPPGHCTGAAVDVSVLGPDGEPLDVKSPTEGWEAAYTYSDRISPEAKRNRMVMVEAMLAAGFSNCREEYWHYSWGDSAWAVRVGERQCPYGFVEPAIAVETGFEGAEAAELTYNASTGHWRCCGVERDGSVGLHFGIFWAEQKRVAVRIDSPLPARLFVSADRKEWSPVEFETSGECAWLHVEPSDPRLYVASDPPRPAD